MPRQCLSDEEAATFVADGYVILRQVLHPDELQHFRAAMDRLTTEGCREVKTDPDFMYGIGHRTGQKVLRRIEYVVDKALEARVLLGHPFILRSVEKLQGPDLVPTWDTMVLKLPGEGIIVPWHRDASSALVGDHPPVNVDFYLVPADHGNCVWLFPGSHRWAPAQADAIIHRPGFSTDGATPALMQPGDVIIHHILTVHGSPANESQRMRRVVYYEFRPAHTELALGPHTPAYIPLKQKVLLKCLALRAACAYVPPDEVPYVYHPPPPFDDVRLHRGEELATYRYPHPLYWRHRF